MEENAEDMNSVLKAMERQGYIKGRRMAIMECRREAFMEYFDEVLLAGYLEGFRLGKEFEKNRVLKLLNELKYNPPSYLTVRDIFNKLEYDADEVNND